MLPLEIARLPGGRARVLPFAQARRPLLRGNPDWVLFGNHPRLTPEVKTAILDRYLVMATFGELQTPTAPLAGRGNRVRVFVLKRRDGAGVPDAGEP